MSDQANVVETQHLCRFYGDGATVRALDDVSLIISRGDFLTVMGPSGSGKSTLLHMIGALDRPTSGQVIVNGEDLATIRDVDHFRAQTVGFVFQLHNLLPALTARENVEVPMRGQGLSERDVRRRSRAERGNGWPWLALWPRHQPSSWPMSLPGVSTRKVAQR
jgi:ABC-type lipoprotein export system ATPase subunit